MAYVPGCSADVFISYAHEDDRDDWVSGLCQCVARILAPRLPGVQVWLDEDIKSGEYPQHKIQDRLRNTPVFVAIVSPSYLESRYCRDLELDFFLNQGGRGQDVIQLVKVPLARPERDVPLPDAKWVPLYNQSDLRELTGKRLESALIKPVLDIQNRLMALWEACPKVFLAQIEADTLTRPWNLFKEALREEGFAVLPNNMRLTDRRQDLIEDNIERAAISIHLSPVRDDALASRQLDIARRVGKPLVLFDRAPHAGDMRSAIERIHRTLNTPRPPAVYFVYDDYSDGKRVHALQDQIRLHTGFEGTHATGRRKVPQVPTDDERWCPPVLLRGTRRMVPRAGAEAAPMRRITL